MPKFVDLGLTVSYIGSKEENIADAYYCRGDSIPYRYVLEQNGISYSGNQGTYKDFIFDSRLPDRSKEKYEEMGKDIQGTKYDPVSYIFGSGYKMPNYMEVLDLQTSCTWELQEDKETYKVTGPNENFIFFNINDSYWMSTTYFDTKRFGYVFGYEFGVHPVIGPTIGGLAYKYQARLIRPVKIKTYEK